VGGFNSRTCCEGEAVKFRYFSSLLVWLLLAAIAGAAEPLAITPAPADWPTQVEVGELLVLEAPEDAQGVAWSVYPTETDCREFATERAIVVATSHAGVVIVAMASGSADAVTVCQLAIVIGQPSPEPGPVPPVPDPPTPVVGKLHVLLIYESTPNKPGSLSPDQSGIPTAVPLLEYLAEHCADENGSPAYRFLDINADIDGMPDDWQTSIKRGIESSGGKKPWLIIAAGDGKKTLGSYEGPLPEDLDATMELLHVYGGK
jgi:hypothetical protein